MTRPLRVMVDARMLIGRFSGVSRVVTQLVDALARQDGLEVVTLCAKIPYPEWEGRTDIEMVTSDFGPGDRTACRRVMWEETKLPRIIRRAGADLFHATWNSGVPALCPVPSVLTIHDLIPWRKPEAYFATARQRWCYRYATRSSARRAARITTVSEYVKHQVVDLLGLDPQRLAVIPNGVEMPSQLHAGSRTSQTPYVLYVGGHDARKNVAGIFAVMQHYWEKFDRTLELRVTGRISSLSPDAMEAFGRLHDRSRVRFLGDVDDAELIRQYESAELLLMLSRDEGFGLPVVEAMALGCPVVAAARAVLPEVVGDAGKLVDPDKVDEVTLAMRDLLSSPAARADYIKRGRDRARTFDWKVLASRMRTVYEDALGKVEKSPGLEEPAIWTGSPKSSTPREAPTCSR